MPEIVVATPANLHHAVGHDPELAGLWRIAEGDTLPWSAGLKLLILTGARRSEVFRNAERRLNPRSVSQLAS